MAKTTVFKSGNSQAVRLPKEFRFKSKTVEILRRGDAVVLREKARTMADLIVGLPVLGADFPLDIPDYEPSPVPGLEQLAKTRGTKARR